MNVLPNLLLLLYTAGLVECSRIALYALDREGKIQTSAGDNNNSILRAERVGHAISGPERQTLCANAKCEFTSDAAVF